MNNTYKIKKALAAVSAEGINSLINLVSDPSLRAQLTTTALVVKIPYVFLKELESAETDDFMEKTLDPEVLSKKIITSSAYQQALGETLQKLAYTPNKTKRDLIKKIFLSAYISQDDYAKNHLERLQYTTQQISLPALQHLFFVKKEILSIRNDDIRQKLQKLKPTSDLTNYDGLEMLKRQTPISNAYDQWFKGQNETNKLDVATSFGSSFEQNRRQYFNEYWSELVSLCIFRQGNSPKVGTFGGGSGTVYYLTEYGEKFLTYLESISLDQES